MSFLENLCVGQAQKVIAGLSCLENRKMAYEMAWTRLEKRFGNPRKLLTLVKQNLLDGPPIKEWDAKELMSLCNKMCKCKTSFQGWEKEELLNSEELLRSIFLRLPYKLRYQFVTITHGNGGGSFFDLRLLVENAALSSRYRIWSTAAKVVQLSRRFDAHPDLLGLLSSAFVQAGKRRNQRLYRHKRVAGGQAMEFARMCSTLFGNAKNLDVCKYRAVGIM